MEGTNYILNMDSYSCTQLSLNYILSPQEQCPHSGPHDIQETGPATTNWHKGNAGGRGGGLFPL